MTANQTCPFCNLKQRVLRSNKHAKAFLSDPRKVPGHMLVIPERHVEKPWELTGDEIKDIFELIFEIEQKFIGKLGDGCVIRQNYLPYINQSKVKVDHVHFHIIPRALNDYLYSVSGKYEESLFAKLDAAEAKAVADLLK